MSRGYVYVLSNPAMPNIYKIGKTTQSPEQRAKQLSDATGVPEGFEVLVATLMPDCNVGEKTIHDEFQHVRINPNREFFGCDLREVTVAIDNELRRQMEFIVDEFLPGESLVEYDYVFDPSYIDIWARDLGVSLEDVIYGLYELTNEEVQPGVSRWQKRQPKGGEKAKVIQIDEAKA